MAYQHSSSADIAVKTMDLTRATADLVSGSGLLTGLTKRLFQWLAREGIAETEFEICLEKLRGVLYPNESALKIQRHIREAHERLSKLSQIAGLQLVQPGCVGRSMIMDPDFCYVVTTVAALLTQHDLDYATDAVCSMALDEHSHDQINNFHSIYKARLQPVVTKIVGSIAFNIVNSGHGLGSMPEFLLGTCKHGIKPGLFAAIAMAVARCTDDILITCTRLLADVFVWLMAHVNGTLELSIAGRILYEEQLGTGPRKVVMLVHETCPFNNGIHDRFQNEIEVAATFGSKFRSLIRFTIPNYQPSYTRGVTRAKLYQLSELDDFIKVRYEGLNRSELHRAKVVAQSIITWMMDLPLMPTRNHTFVEFTTEIEDKDKGITSLGKLLRQYPAICNWELTADRAQCSFVQKEQHSDITENLSPEQAFSYFPEALDLVDLVGKRCTCVSCRKSRTDMTRGCLRAAVLDNIVILISNAIADGFGASDWSRMADFEVVQKGILRLLSELLCSKVVTWETWCAVAASVFLGCPWSAQTVEEGAGDIAAVQFGSLVVAASWVDLSTELHVEGSFGFEIAEGRLQGVGADFAVIYSEGTMPPAFGQYEPPASFQKLQNCLEVDQSEVILQTAIIGASGTPFRLLSMVKSGNARRIVNPALALVSLCYCEKTNCPHDASSGAQSVNTNHSVWTFRDVLAHWNVLNSCDTNDSQDMADKRGTTYHTLTMDSALKVNLALALSPWGCAIRSGRCCVACAELRAGVSPRRCEARRIINVEIVKKHSRLHQ